MPRLNRIRGYRVCRRCRRRLPTADFPILPYGRSQQCADCRDPKSRLRIAESLTDDPSNTARLPLSNDSRTVLVDADLVSSLAVSKWFLVDGYPHACRNWKLVKLHRVVLGFPPYKIDHKNGDLLNAMRSNLRRATDSENAMNRPRVKSRAGYKGVTRRVLPPSRRNPTERVYWEAKVQAEGKVVYLGSFRSPEEAARAYDELARRLHGQFARLNFPGDGEQGIIHSSAPSQTKQPT